MSDQAPTLPFNRSHAFIIGINDYQHISPLKTAINDAKGIAQRLESKHGYIVHGPLLNPTKAELEQLFFETMTKEVGEEDRVIFYFAGHGIALDSEGGPNGYIVPVDAKQGDKESLIPMDDLHITLKHLPCKHGLLILDCCFSGAFRWSAGYRDIVFDLPKVIYQERFYRYTRDEAWQVITSAAHDQKAVDVISHQSIGMREEGAGEHSPFALALFKAIEGEADVIPAGKGDGVITASELYAYLRDEVESQTVEHAKRQSPSMFNLARHANGEFIFLSPGHILDLEKTPKTNPFMGLASYEKDKSQFFFGRDRVIKDLLKKVAENPLTVVSGASGTGKSSVIKAGVLSALEEKGWTFIGIIRPGKEPSKVLKQEIGEISNKLVPDQKTILIVDQYEELITQCLHEKDKVAFEQQLAEWISDHKDLHIILSIRSDFEPQLDSTALKAWWQRGRYVVPAFNLEEIREIITKPAIQASLVYQPESLISRLEEEVSQAPGALPLLSFTLSELYEGYIKRGAGEERDLTEEDYDKIGGVIGSLRKKADELYLSEDAVHQESMRRLMLRMVSFEGGELASRRVLKEELVYVDAEETARVEAVAERLTEARLIRSGVDSQGRNYMEPAHDALVRAWARLWEWIKKEGEVKLGLRYKLGLAVLDHQAHSESAEAEDYLWHEDPRLDLIHADLEDPQHSFNQKEEAFVRASMGLKKKKAKQRKRLIIGTILLLAGIAAVAIWQGIVATQEARDARAAALASEARRLDPLDHTLALNLAYEAYQTSATAQAVNTLSQFASDSRQHVYLDKYHHDEFNLDSLLLLFEGQVEKEEMDKTLTVLNNALSNLYQEWKSSETLDIQPNNLDGLGRPKRFVEILPPDSSPIQARECFIEMSPLGILIGINRQYKEEILEQRESRLPTRLIQGNLLFLDRTGKEQWRKTEMGEIQDLAHSPKGLYSLHGDQKESAIYRWNLSGNPLDTMAGTTPVSRIAVSQDGKQIAFGGEDSVWIRQIEGEPSFFRKVDQQGNVCGLAWSPGGDRLLVARRDHSIADIALSEEQKDAPEQEFYHASAVEDVRFDDTGRYFLTIGQVDGTEYGIDSSYTEIRRWELGQNELAIELMDETILNCINPEILLSHGRTQEITTDSCYEWNAKAIRLSHTAYQLSLDGIIDSKGRILQQAPAESGNVESSIATALEGETVFLRLLQPERREDRRKRRMSYAIWRNQISRLEHRTIYRLNAAEKQVFSID